jgi:hypothetical protein
MTKLVSVVIITLMAVGAAWAETKNAVSVASGGWTITADAEKGTLNIAHDKLGTVMRQVHLNLQSERGLRALKNWSVDGTTANSLSIRTAQPPTGWMIECSGNSLKISSTSTSAVITAEVPASPERVPARILDTRGAPVEWKGTAEVEHSYGGSETVHPSYLPTRNPEVMTFALGQIASANLHSLFDRRSDTVISFSDQTLLRRNARDRDLLDATIPVPGNTVIRLVPDYFTKTLGVPYYIPNDDSHFPTAPVVWCSWTSYYAEVKEDDIVRNADWLAAHLKPYGFEFVQLDDGYDRAPNGEHFWIENWDKEKFPHGPQWLTDHIKSKGLRAGLWLVPNAYAGAFKEHPDWYVYDKQGKVIRDYNTPALDSTNPEVLNFLKKLFTTLDDWGFEYYKFDGEHALPQYVPGLDKNRLYDKSVDPLVAYRRRLKLIRETMGPNRFIEGCPAGTPLNGIGYFNSYFNGDDVFNSWQGMYALFSSINANAFLNHLVVYLMPGEGIDVQPRMTVAEAEKKRVRSVVGAARTRETPLAGFGATLPEAHTLVSYVSLTGVVYPLASVMPELPEERVKLLKMTMPTMPILPVDLFSRGTDMRWDRFKTTQPDFYIHNYPEILDLKVNARSGVYDVVGFTNWRSAPATREISLTDKLGLDAGASYLAFDFWSQKLLGVVKDRMKIDIEPHDTRVLLIHPFLNRPQLVGTSRHITGAYSILDLAWDATKNTLRGSSRTVAGEPYTLWFYVPEGVTIAAVGARTKENREVPVQHELAGNSLKVSLQGQPENVDWEVKFTARLGH